MSNNVRRLALDIAPWVWVFIAFQLCGAILFDCLWVRRSGAAMPLLPGMVLYIGATLGGQKVTLWRILPVTRKEIDRARWWQGIGMPGLFLCIVAGVTALVMGWLELRRATWPDIAILALAQSAIGALMMAAVAVAFPFIASKLGRWSALLLIPLFLAIFRIAVPMRGQTDISALIMAGLLTSAGLYILAGRWPMPLTTALWSVREKDRATPRLETAREAGLRGWPILVWGNLPTFAILWSLATVIPLAMKWFFPGMELGAVVWIAFMGALHFSVQGIATGMRTLRALPLSGRQLTCRLVFLVLLVQAISLVIAKAVLLISGGRTFAPVIFLLPLAYSLLYLPIALRFGLRVIQFCFGLSIIFIIPMQFIVPEGGAILWIVIGSLLVMATGVGWTYWEITRGHRAYCVQPLVPARWRGF